MTRNFDDLVESGDLTPDERRRLEHVHEMLVAAGPPPDLPAALLEAPAPAESGGEVVELADRRRRRRRAAGALIAAVVALACLGGGYLIGDRAGSDGDVVRVVSLAGVNQPARASIRLGREQPGGNWPMELRVTGLPQQPDRGYYELFVWRDGEPSYPCVGFKMRDGTTTVRFSVPYELKDDTELVVTAIQPGIVRWPGKVVMRTT